MKKILIGFLLLLVIGQANAQQLKIDGELKNILDGTKISLIDGMVNRAVDSSKVTTGKFSLTHKIEYPGIYILLVALPAAKPAQIPIFVGNDQLTMRGDINEPQSIQYNGSESQDLYIAYMNALIPKIESLFATTSLLASAKNNAKDSLSKQVDLKQADFASTITNLLKANNQSPVSTLFLIQTTNLIPYIKEHIADLYALLDGPAKKGPFAELIEKTLLSANIGKIGSVLPEFKQNDVNGKLVSLHSFRGKYVLVDFWASWCGPCRGENPNVVKAYNKFKDKGFTILGVSLDQDKAKWLEAIKKDGLAWTHVSDLKYWNNAVAVQFGIQSIPANFLLDPNGVIIGKDLRGEDLVKILASNLK